MSGRLRIGIQLAALAVVAAMAAPASAAFVVEAHTSGKANATNFSFGGDTTSATASVASAAVGLSATNSVFAGNGTVDTYVFTYIPGSNDDNTVLAAGTVLGSTTGFPGEGNVATGLPGGGSGLYRVYFTTPASTNVDAAGSNFTITQDGAPIVLNPVNLNNGGTGPDTDPGTAFVGGANNAWYLLGTVNLVSGNAYTVTQTANSNTFVSQRAHGVMWEAIPEPGSLSLLALGGLAILRRGRRS